jgi:hypothetical protein
MADAPLITPTPVAPAAPVNTNLFAKPGESVQDYETRLGGMNAGEGTGFGTPVPAQPVTDLSTAHDEVAKQLGFNSYSDALQKLGAPSQSTTDFYNAAYKTAGLDTLSSSIASKKQALNDAIGKISDNPWLDEANRVGRTRNLQTLANGDIKNLTDEYNAKLKSVHDLVSQHDTDVKNNTAKLSLLESQAKAFAAEAATKAKTDAAPPKTIKAANGATYQWNPATNSFDPLFAGKTSSSKQFNFSPKQLLSLQTRGLPNDAANNILSGIKQGVPLEQLRQDMKNAKIDPGILDEVMYYVDPKHNTTPKATASSTPSLPPGVTQ